MAKKRSKATADERAEVEDELAAAVCMRLAAPTESEAGYWEMEANRLRASMTPAGIKRGERRGADMAERKPPGWLVASEAIDVFDRLMKVSSLSRRDQDEIWSSIMVIALYQLGALVGPFYDSAAKCGLASDRLGEVIRREITRKRNVAEFN